MHYGVASLNAHVLVLCARGRLQVLDGALTSVLCDFVSAPVRELPALLHVICIFPRGLRSKLSSPPPCPCLTCYMLTGMPVPQMSSYLPDADGWPYQLQVFPVIERLLTSTGSMLGGTTVQIQGRGFPTLSKNLGDVVSISIAGVPCVPLPASKTAASNFNTIACVTSALPANYTAPVAISGLYPGALCGGGW